MWGLVEGLQARTDASREMTHRALRCSPLRLHARASRCAHMRCRLRRGPARAQIGLPPVLHFGSDALKARVAPECLQARLQRRSWSAAWGLCLRC